MYSLPSTSVTRQPLALAMKRGVLSRTVSRIRRPLARKLDPVSVTSMLAWMDLEMTGLDHTSDVIVEIATIITDDDLQIIAEGPDLVVHQSDEVLAAMNDVVTDMHTASGLLDEIRSSTLSLEEAGRLTLDFIREHCPQPGTVPLCPINSSRRTATSPNMVMFA